MDASAAGVRDRLRGALTPAMRARDTAAVAALRSALAALDNAAAVPTGAGAGPVASSARVAGAVAGLGAAEVPRRELTEAEQVAIVRTEVAEREAAAADCDRAAQPDHAARLRAEAAALTPHLPT